MVTRHSLDDEFEKSGRVWFRNAISEEDLAGFLAHCDDEASKDVLYDNGRQLSALIGRATTPLKQAVQTAIG